ncbi:MAG: hypothetical protein Q4F83_04390 [Eubacteriales bacterium]|nr:hypothetical protein [Eubacteriales bacterium]
MERVPQPVQQINSVGKNVLRYALDIPEKIRRKSETGFKGLIEKRTWL